jgi:hypothetical protein
MTSKPTMPIFAAGKSGQSNARSRVRLQDSDNTRLDRGDVLQLRVTSEGSLQEVESGLEVTRTAEVGSCEREREPEVGGP